eukprot:TRINITY_DN10227_c0_g1_i2.p1 TRINITY_DN10227_c0_g1~~TRINITY_DN10227_c0_g1_i2.p1  ORF type:complete len:155 (+),score=39.16 TRINITY_DN10227_c0_g1_i2:463-927(+)
MPKGDALISYEDPYAATAAISWSHRKPYSNSNSIISVQLATPKETYSAPSRGGFGRGRGRGGRGGGGGGGSGVPSGRGGKENDWVCVCCENSNFGWRPNCNRCGAPKSIDNEGLPLDIASQDGYLGDRGGPPRGVDNGRSGGGGRGGPPRGGER